MPLKYIGPSGRGTIYIVDQKHDGTVLMLSCTIDDGGNAVGTARDATSEVELRELRYPMYEADDDVRPTIIDVTPLPSGVQRLPTSSFVEFATRAATLGEERVEMTRGLVDEIRYQGPNLGTPSH